MMMDGFDWREFLGIDKLEELTKNGADLRTDEQVIKDLESPETTKFEQAERAWFLGNKES
jgi:hypothetical protein